MSAIFCSINLAYSHTDPNNFTQVSAWILWAGWDFLKIIKHLWNIHVELKVNKTSAYRRTITLLHLRMWCVTWRMWIWHVSCRALRSIWTRHWAVLLCHKSVTRACLWWHKPAKNKIQEIHKLEERKKQCRYFIYFYKLNHAIQLNQEALKNNISGKIICTFSNSFIM